MLEQREARHRSSNPSFSIRTGQLDYNTPEIVYRPRQRTEAEPEQPAAAPAYVPASAPASSLYSNIHAAAMTKAQSPSKGVSTILTGRPSSVAVPKVTVMMSGNDWIEYARSLKQQRKLCGPLWYEGEVCILFADTNLGKSLLAVQIAEMIANGHDCDTAIPELRPDTDPQKVIYADFELSIQQFAQRYSAESADGTPEFHKFNPMLYRVSLVGSDQADLSADISSGRKYADLVISDLEARVVQTDATVLIVDNITYMASGTETAADALPLMKRLIALKKQYNLSILLLAHTPKRDQSRAIDRNDIQGSKMLINFADSAFCIGESCKGSSLRYIKQIKQRNCGQVFDADNVLECEIDRLSDTFLGFRSTGLGLESDHLAEPENTRGNEIRKAALRERREAMLRQINDLAARGLGVNEIAAEMKVNRTTVYRLMKKDSEDTQPHQPPQGTQSIAEN